MNTILQTPTNDLRQSLDFYKKLNFKILSAENPTLVTDGKTIIEINPDRFARAGVKFYKNNWATTVEQLQKTVNVLSIENGYLLSDQSGVWIYLMESNSTVNFDLSAVDNSTLGNYAGLSLETTDIQKSIETWEILGFSKTMGSIEQGWVAYENQDKMGVSFMQPNSCPHLFFNPSLTYFNGKDNLSIIARIREAGISITEEITHFNEKGIVDNIIIRDPGGFGFFIFSD
ncbi:MAG: VOC family protein [Saprospiraceae bacterium]